MQITMLTYGSRGDVQPFLALALGLRKAGHTVRLAAPERFDNFISRHGIEFSKLTGDPEVISARLSNAGTNPLKMVRAISDYVNAIAPQVVRDAKAALAGADLLIHSFLFTTGGHSFAREMGIADISMQTFPMFAPTRAFPNVAMAHIPPGRLSQWTHQIATAVFWHGGNAGYRRLRRQDPAAFPEKLSWPFQPEPGRPLTPLVFAYSPSVLPRPADWAQSHISVPGYFFLEEAGASLPAGVSDFIASGEPPVCISFGSVMVRDSAQLERVVLSALEKTGQRGILLSGWAKESNPKLPGNVLRIDAAPHDLLFPQCRALVHHGGAGTTGAALRSGVPNIVIPFSADQAFWGTRVAALGAGPRPIPIKAFQVETLVQALEQALQDEQMRRRAAQIGARIRREDGVGKTVQLVENWAAGFPHTPRQG